MIKVLVELPDGHKYCINVSTAGDTSNGIEWSAVLNELVKQYPIITPDKHVFEVFDTDFNEFYVISSDGHMIDNLSRIRVSDKRIGNQLSDQSVCVTIDDDSRNAKKRRKLRQWINRFANYLNNSGNTYTGNSNDPKLDTQGMGAEYLDTKASATKLIQTVVPNVNKDMANDNTIRSTCSRCSSFSSCDTYYSSDWSTSLKSDDNFPEMLEMATQLSSGINDTITSTPVPTIAPVGDSQQNPIDYLGLPVRNIGYCGDIGSRYLFYRTISIPMGSLWIRCISFIATDVITINKMLYLLDKYRPINGKLMDDQGWAQVANELPRSRHYHEMDVIFNGKKCRKYLNNALDLYKKTLTSCPDMEIAGLVNPLFYLLHVFDPQLILSDDECQEIQRLRQQFTDKCANNPNAISIITDTIISVKPVAKIVQPTQTNTATITQLTQVIDSHLPQATFGGELSLLYKMSAQLTEQDLQWFYTLCQCIDRTVQEWGRYRDNKKTFWPYVTNCMTDFGLIVGKRFCRQLFIHHVTNHYKNALKHLGQYSKAVEVYPLFQVIHDMDLRQSLSKKSCQKINKFRKTFKM